MPRFSTNSIDQLSTCDYRLQLLCHVLIEDFDFKVIEGYRNEERQNEAYRNGKSKLQYPHSKHNQNPSLAVDLAPYPIDWNNTDRFILLAGHMLHLAKLYRIPIIWGGDWHNQMATQNKRISWDLGHFELDD